MKYMGQVKGKAYPILQRLPDESEKPKKKLKVIEPPKPKPKIEPPNPRRHKKRGVRETCEVCGKKITGGRRTYCSNSCMLEGRRRYAEDYRRKQRERRKAEEDGLGTGAKAGA